MVICNLNHVLLLSFIDLAIYSGKLAGIKESEYFLRIDEFYSKSKKLHSQGSGT